MPSAGTCCPKLFVVSGHLNPLLVPNGKCYANCNTNFNQCCLLAFWHSLNALILNSMAVLC